MRRFSEVVQQLFDSMTVYVREATSEQGLYPRVSIILLEVVRQYCHLFPAGLKVVIHPSLVFMGTDKATDYAVVVMTTVSF